MSFSYFCAIDFHFSKGGEKKSLYSSASKWTQEACPSCSARGQQDCSVAAAAFPTWGPTVTPGSNRPLLLAVNRWRAMRHTLCQGASKIVDNNRGGLGALCYSYFLPCQEGISLLLGPSLYLSQAHLHPSSLPWTNQNWSPSSILLTLTASPSSLTLILPPYDGSLESLFS